MEKHYINNTNVKRPKENLSIFTRFHMIKNHDSFSTYAEDGKPNIIFLLIFCRNYFFFNRKKEAEFIKTEPKVTKHFKFYE